jgi:hypothetical protein
MATVPVPRTWAVGEFVTDAMMNGSTGIRDAFNFILAPPRCQVRRTTSLGQTTATWTAVTWDVEDYDTDGVHTAGSAGFVINTAGVYQLTGAGSWAANTAGIRGVRWLVNAVSINAGAVFAPPTAALEVVVPARTLYYYLNVGDVLTMELYQSSGASLGTSVSAPTVPHAELRWVST